MQSMILKVLGETIQVTLLVLLMMVAVDALNVWTRGKIALLLKQGHQWRQYIISSFIGHRARMCGRIYQCIALHSWYDQFRCARRFYGGSFR
jgi:hypothetical protein